MTRASMDRVPFLLDPGTAMELNAFLKRMDRMFTRFKEAALILHAIEGGVFDECKEPREANEIATRFGWDPGMARLFCKSLVQAGLLVEVPDLHAGTNPRFMNTRSAMDFLTSSSPAGQINNMTNKIRKVKAWMNMPTYLSEGSMVRDEQVLCTRGWIEGIAESIMDGQIPRLVTTICEHVDLARCTSMLDLGGGHGLYAMAFAERFPGLRCIVYDKTGIIDAARDRAARHRISVGTIAGDYTKDPLPGPQDVVFLSFTPAGSDLAFTEKIHGILAPGGHLIIRRHAADLGDDALLNLEWNFIRPRGRRVGNSRFNVNNVPSIEEHVHHMTRLGFQLVHQERFDELSDLVIARKEEGRES